MVGQRRAHGPIRDTAGRRCEHSGALSRMLPAAFNSSSITASTWESVRGGIGRARRCSSRGHEERQARTDIHQAQASSKRLRTSHEAQAT